MSDQLLDDVKAELGVIGARCDPNQPDYKYWMVYYAPYLQLLEWLRALVERVERAVTERDALADAIAPHRHTVEDRECWTDEDGVIDIKALADAARDAGEAARELPYKVEQLKAERNAAVQALAERDAQRCETCEHGKNMRNTNTTAYGVWRVCGRLDCDCEDIGNTCGAWKAKEATNDQS